MKRLMALLLACAVLALSITLVSCRLCREHAWDEGEITTEPTDTSDGVRTFTCSLCKRTKTETVSLAELVEEAWNAALATEVFENFCYKEWAYVSNKTSATTSKLTCKFTKSAAWARITVAGKSEEGTTVDKEEVRETREKLVKSLRDILSYESYTYDAQTDTYKANEELYIESLDASTSNISVTFDGVRFVKIEYEVMFKKSGSTYTARATITLSDYGTTTID